MRVKWLGHACFLVSSNTGMRIIIDPYAVQGGLNYGEIDESADVVLSSHSHYDHSNAGVVKGHPRVISGAGTEVVRGVSFRGIAAYHDETEGSKRGNNVIFAFELDGVRVCHLGDLGHDLSEVQVKEIGKVDLLFVPAGGLYTFDVAVANRVCNALAPRIIVPMHFRTPKVDTALFGAIAGPDDFLKGKPVVERRDSSEAEFDGGNLPAATRVIVLKPAL
jgi:L-ascorbate metabolism protein UlaG (beta-lactamase superfamily)